MAEDAGTHGTRGTDGTSGVGSVAEETARLLDALLGGAGTGGRTTTPYDAPPADPEAGEAAHGGPHDGPHDGDAAGDPASVCHLCPVCQLLRVARAVRPETVDRLADLAALLTQSLREVAASRRAEEPPARARPRPGPQVEDIPLDDLPDDLPDDPTDADPEETPR